MRIDSVVGMLKTTKFSITWEFSKVNSHVLSVQQFDILWEDY